MVPQVCKWLNEVLQLGEYSLAFRAAGVDGSVLVELEDSDLTGELGVGSRLHRKKILTRLKQMLGR